MGVAFFAIAAYDTETQVINYEKLEMVSGVNSDILWFFVPLLVLTFYLGRINRWAYVVSGLLFLPLMLLNLRPFLWTTGFMFTYVLAGILLVIGTRRMQNRPFAAQALHVATQLFFALLLSMVLQLALLAIAGSLDYIFALNLNNHNVYTHLWQFVWFVVAPQVCCSMIGRGEANDVEPARVLQLLLNFILSPAVVVYTVILYAYFIKIVLTWDLPKGGVAAMVMAFITASLAGRLLQEVLAKRYFDWFYRHFTWIALPPLVLYWVGSVYRIRLYSFTEGRFYLMVAGVLMTLFVLMLLWQRTRRFQLMAFIFGCAIIVFTYIPGISAKSIGISCQTERLEQCIAELNLTDSTTHKLKTDIDTQAIQRDSLLSQRFVDVCSIVQYLRSEMGNEDFAEKYGEWEISGYDIAYSPLKRPTTGINRDQASIDLGEYHVLVASEYYKVYYHDGHVIVSQKDGQQLMDYPIDSLSLSHQRSGQELLRWSNDSLLLLLPNIGICGDTIDYVYSNDPLLFRK